VKFGPSSKGSSAKFSDVEVGLRISQRKLKALGVHQEIPSKPVSLKEAVRSLIELEVLEEEDADLISTDRKERQGGVDREKADEAYLKCIKESLEEKQVEGKRAEEKSSKEKDTNRKKDSLEERKKESNIAEVNGEKIIREKGKQRSSLDHLLVQCIRSKLPELAKEFIMKAKMIEDIPVTNDYCWWCRKLGHLAKYCQRLPEKIRNMCMGCGRTDHHDQEKCYLTEETCAKCGTVGHHRSIHIESDFPKRMMLIEHWGLDGFEETLMANKKKILLSKAFETDEDSEEENSAPKRRKS